MRATNSLVETFATNSLSIMYFSFCFNSFSFFFFAPIYHNLHSIYISNTTSSYILLLYSFTNINFRFLNKNTIPNSTVKFPHKTKKQAVTLSVTSVLLLNCKQVNSVRKKYIPTAKLIQNITIVSIVKIIFYKNIVKRFCETGQKNNITGYF